MYKAVSLSPFISLPVKEAGYQIPTFSRFLKEFRPVEPLKKQAQYRNGYTIRTYIYIYIFMCVPIFLNRMTFDFNTQQNINEMQTFCKNTQNNLNIYLRSLNMYLRAYSCIKFSVSQHNNRKIVTICVVAVLVDFNLPPYFKKL